MIAPWSNDRLVSYTPVVTCLLLDGGAVGQITRMIREHTAAGQSLWSWCAVVLALALWGNFYRVKIPHELPARLFNALAVVVNLGIVATVLYFRLIA